MISNKLKIGLLAAVGAAVLTMSAPASALTLSTSSPAVTTAGSDVQDVQWRRYGYWHPHRYWGGYGYWHPHRRCWVTPWGWRCGW
jgi:hypothetical protein